MDLHDWGAVCGGMVVPQGGRILFTSWMVWAVDLVVGVSVRAKG